MYYDNVPMNTHLLTYSHNHSYVYCEQYQKDSLFRFGKFDGCGPQYQDLRIALKAKMMKDEEEAKALIAQTHYKLNLGSDPKNSPTAGAIWQLKVCTCAL